LRPENNIFAAMSILALAVRLVGESQHGYGKPPYVAGENRYV
jgi:hypothetical protein